MTRSLRILVCTALCCALFAAPAAATHVNCGDVITQDTTLDSDLLNCPGDGVVIGASAVTLDLGGHTIDGSGSGTPTVGVHNAAGHDGVTVTGGLVRDFNRGVAYDDASGGVIRRIATEDVGTAVIVQRSDDLLIERNSTRAAIIVSIDADRNVIRRNDVTGSGTGIIVASSLLPPVFTDSEDNVIEQNHMVDNQFGIFDAGTVRSQISGNRLIGSVEEGIRATVNSFETVIAHNTVTGGGIGIRLATTRNAIVFKNHAADNAFDGILVDGASATGAVLDHNFASRNGDDGVDIDRTGVTVRRTVANQNGDLGIEAVPGTIDGGGNKASGNGNPAQCVGVSCK